MRGKRSGSRYEPLAKLRSSNFELSERTSAASEPRELRGPTGSPRASVSGGRGGDEVPPLEQMKIQFTQSGGFAGLIKQAHVDTDTLSADDSKQLAQLVQDSGLSDSHQKLSDQGRDLEQYEIHLDDGSRKTSVVFDAKTVPPSVKPLVGYLRKLARPKM